MSRSPCCQLFCEVGDLTGFVFFLTSLHLRSVHHVMSCSRRTSGTKQSLRLRITGTFDREVRASCAFVALCVLKFVNEISATLDDEILVLLDSPDTHLCYVIYTYVWGFLCDCIVVLWKVPRDDVCCDLALCE